MYVSNPKQRSRPRRIEPPPDYDPLSLLEELKSLAKQPSRPHEINWLRRAVARQANASLKAHSRLLKETSGAIETKWCVVMRGVRQVSRHDKVIRRFVFQTHILGRRHLEACVKATQSHLSLRSFGTSRDLCSFVYPSHHNKHWRQTPE